ncbi:MAG: SGNH/GDSL hydrolase family protein [Planctomycetia bacterium]|nr:SGNH/GDSL hydrolase family protein [Planctomycetia bacterium]
MFTLYTFGDSILDCGHYNTEGMSPGRLIVKNADPLFPEFAGRDLASRGPARLVHRARDGAGVKDLAAQAAGLSAPTGPSAALVTAGGNDLLAGLARDPGAGVAAMAEMLDAFLDALPVRPVLLGNVYDPTFGDDARNFLGIPTALARANLTRVNDAIAAAARRLGPGLGVLVDLHAHFLTGDPSWFVNVIEPSLVGSSEVRRAFLPGVLGTD